MQRLCCAPHLADDIQLFVAQIAIAVDPDTVGGAVGDQL